MGPTPTKYRLLSVISAFGSGLWMDNFVISGDNIALVCFTVLAAISGFCYNRGNN